MTVPMLDIAGENAAIREQIVAAVEAVIDSSGFILGPTVERFERELAEYCGVRHAIGLSSGSDALLVGLMARQIGPGDEVIVPAFTFFATAGSVARLGARPVFADIDPRTFNLDAEDAAGRITDRTKAIIPVHLFGQCAAMGAIAELAGSHELFVLEDAAQSIGAERHGKRAGAIGDAGCLSFFPTKNLGGLGDGGALLTDDDDLAERVRQIRHHGQTDAYRHERIGGNFRLDAIQAAALSVKLRHLDGYIDGRRAAADRYARLLDGLPLTLPAPDPDNHHVFNQYTVRCGDREALSRHLEGQSIGHKVYYPLPLHRQPCFASPSEGPGELPEAERACEEVLSLPMHPRLSEDEQRRVAEAIRSFYA